MMHGPVVAILAAGVAGWLFGAIWYGVLGKAWQRALGMDAGDCKDRKMPAVAILVSFLAALVMSAVLYQLQVNLGVAGALPGALTGLTIGAGFLLASTIVNNMFQGRSWKITVIDGGHWVLAVTVEATVIGALL